MCLHDILDFLKNVILFVIYFSKTYSTPHVASPVSKNKHKLLENLRDPFSVSSPSKTSL